MSVRIVFVGEVIIPIAAGLKHPPLCPDQIVRAACAAYPVLGGVAHLVVGKVADRSVLGKSGQLILVVGVGLVSVGVAVVQPLAGNGNDVIIPVVRVGEHSDVHDHSPKLRKLVPCLVVVRGLGGPLTTKFIYKLTKDFIDAFLLI